MAERDDDLARAMVKWLYDVGYLAVDFHDLRLSYFVAQVDIELCPGPAVRIAHTDGSPRYPDGSSVADLVAEAEAGDASDHG